MTRFFFDAEGKNPKLNERILRYIFSLLDSEDQINVSKVCTQWKILIELTQEHMRLLPDIHRVPQLAKFGLDALDIHQLSGGMTNKTYKLTLFSNDKKVIHKKLVLRVSGQGSEAFINRQEEGHNALIASELGLNVPILHFDPQDGLQLTKYIENAHDLNETLLQQDDVLRTIAQMERRLHTSKKAFKNIVAIFQRNEELLKGLKAKTFAFPVEIDFIEEQMTLLKALFSCYQIDLCPCHNDTTPSNFLLSFAGDKPDTETSFYQSDWEYSNMSDFIWDLAYFSELGKLPKDRQLLFLAYYFGEQFNNEKTRESIYAWFTAYKPILQWWIALWSWTQVANEANAVDLSEYKRWGLDSYKITMTHLQGAEYQRAVAVIAADKVPEMSLNFRPF